MRLRDPFTHYLAKAAKAPFQPTSAALDYSLLIDDGARGEPLQRGSAIRSSSNRNIHSLPPNPGFAPRRPRRAGGIPKPSPISKNGSSDPGAENEQV